jgi:hypothetical protein
MRLIAANKWVATYALPPLGALLCLCAVFSGRVIPVIAGSNINAAPLSRISEAESLSSQICGLAKFGVRTGRASVNSEIRAKQGSGLSADIPLEQPVGSFQNLSYSAPNGLVTAHSQLLTSPQRDRAPPRFL